MACFIILIDLLVSLHPEIMNLNYTYQPDSIMDPDTLTNPVNLQNAWELSIDQPLPSSPAGKSILEKETPDVQFKVSAPASKKIRQIGKIPANGGMQFIEPRNEVELFALAGESQGLHLPERPVNNQGYDWITLVLLVAVALFASVRTSWNKYLISLFQSTVNYPTALRMFQEKNNSLLQGAFQLDILFYIVFSVFVFQVLEFYRIEYPYPGFFLYLFCVGGIVFFFFIKKTLYRLMGIVIEKRSETGEYLFNADNFKRVAGLVLLPVAAVIAYYPYGMENIPVVAGLSVIVFFYSLLVLRGFVILLKKQFSIFYLFLYFCTLELLPLVLLYKILVV